MQELAVGIAGYGAIGRAVGARLLAGVPGVKLVAIGVRDPAAASPPAADVRVVPAAELGALASVVVECAPASAFPSVAEPALRAGRTLVVLSCAALLRHEDLPALARANGGRILIPTGALSW